MMEMYGAISVAVSFNFLAEMLSGSNALLGSNFCSCFMAYMDILIFLILLILSILNGGR